MKPSSTPNIPAPATPGLPDPLPQHAHFAYVNMAYLEEVAMGNEEFIEVVIRLFLQQTPLFIHQIKAAWQGDDRKKMRQVAHKTKATLATLGILQLEGVIRQLESYPDEASTEEGDQLIIELERICAGVYPELEKKLADMKAA